MTTEFLSGLEGKIPAAHPLPTALAAAVPLWQAQLCLLEWDELLKIADESLADLQEVGEAILYRTGQPGKSAKGFNALARGIAVLSFCPGGVTAFGQKYEAAKDEIVKAARSKIR